MAYIYYLTVPCIPFSDILLEDSSVQFLCELTTANSYVSITEFAPDQFGKGEYDLPSLPRKPFHIGNIHSILCTA